MIFKDRTDAGVQLAAKLSKYKDDPGVVLAIPRGGVPMAYIVARELKFPMDIVLTKKIGHPLNKEYAIGAASLTDYFVIPHEDVSQTYIDEELKRIRARLTLMYQKFVSGYEPQKLTGKTVIVIDDGMATGNTVLSTVNVIKKSMPSKIVVAVPVASQSAIHKLKNLVDEVVALLIPPEFYGVGAFYENFSEVNDEEVLFYMDKLKRLRKTG